MMGVNDTLQQVSTSLQQVSTFLISVSYWIPLVVLEAHNPPNNRSSAQEIDWACWHHPHPSHVQSRPRLKVQRKDSGQCYSDRVPLVDIPAAVYTGMSGCGRGSNHVYLSSSAKPTGRCGDTVCTDRRNHGPTPTSPLV